MMNGFQAKLQPKPYTPRYYITRMGIAANVVVRLVLCGLQGAMACMLSYVGLAFTQTLFGKIVIPGLLQMPVQALASFLPVSLIPYAGTILLVGAVGVIGFNFLHAVWSSMLTSSHMAPSNEDEHFPYALFAFGIPIGLFAFSLSNGLLSLSTSFWLVLGTSAAMGVKKILIEPTIQEMALWQTQKTMHAQAEATYSRSPTPPVTVPAADPPVTVTHSYNTRSQQSLRPAPPIEIENEDPENETNDLSPNSSSRLD